ncbi:MAG: hypothetical protein CFE26_19795, partial [Verrucomicrobiales bacterium VVV1]
MSDPRDWVWYIECRPFIKESDGKAPVKASSMGSAVVVELLAAGEVRNYLLTCGHVVRQKVDLADEEGWGERYGEILCFPPKEAYVFTTEQGRISGTHPQAMIADFHQGTPFGTGAVPPDDRRETNDWVLLKVRDPRFQDYQAVPLWSDVSQDLLMQVIGYPGGAGSQANRSWPSGIVESMPSPNFKQTRTPIQGMLKLDDGSTGAGMSGGGVFATATAQLIGLHRGATPGLLAKNSISIAHIRKRLERVQPVALKPWDQGLGGRDDGGSGGGSEPHTPEPWDSLSTSQTRVIPFINRIAFRQILKDASSPLSDLRGISLTGPSGSGKSWSFHLIRHVAIKKGMPIALLDLSLGQTIALACKRLVRDLSLDVKAMEESVLEDKATEETVGQELAY